MTAMMTLLTDMQPLKVEKTDNNKTRPPDSESTARFQLYGVKRRLCLISNQCSLGHMLNLVSLLNFEPKLNFGHNLKFESEL